jgi:hypothetical protein
VELTYPFAVAARVLRRDPARDHPSDEVLDVLLEVRGWAGARDAGDQDPAVCLRERGLGSAGGSLSHRAVSVFVSELSTADYLFRGIAEKPNPRK